MRYFRTGIAQRLRIRWLFRLPVLARDVRAMLLRRSHGDEGWLIFKERRFAPTVNISAECRSQVDPRGPGGTEFGGDKMRGTRGGYASIYADLLEGWADRARVVIELGVFRGTGLALWSELFTEAEVIGLDIAPERFKEHLPTLYSRGAFSRTTPHVLHFDAFAPDVAGLRRHLEGRTIDVFIDDGPHVLSAIVRTAEALLPLMSADFLYVVEDNHEAAPVLAERFPWLKVAGKGPLTSLRPASSANHRAWDQE
jgi:hypothetical protein